MLQLSYLKNVAELVDDLIKTPTTAEWRNIRRILADRPQQLTIEFTNILVDVANNDASTKTKLLKLFSEIFTELTSDFDQQNMMRKQFLDNWNSMSKQEKFVLAPQDQLGWAGIAYEDECPIFRAWANLGFDDLIKKIAQSKNPLLVQSVVIGVVNIENDFESWKNAAKECPDAFDNKEEWNENILMVILLSRVESYFLPNRFNGNKNICNQSKGEIEHRADEIVQLLASRSDAQPLLLRWATLLMYSILNLGLNKIDDVNSPACYKMALIEKIGATIHESDKLKKWTLWRLPDDCEPWEPWSYLCVQNVWLSGESIHPNDCDGAVKTFLNSWKIEYDDWCDARGLNLRKYAQPFIVISRGMSWPAPMPCGAASMLAELITKVVPCPLKTWNEFWSGLTILREIVEFGDFDSDGSNDYQARSNASDILLFAFSIGLAIFDIFAEQFQKNTTGEKLRGKIVQLHKELFDCVRDMLAIDNTHSISNWHIAFQHLAVRRLLWERGTLEANSETIQIFEPIEKPMVNEYLNFVKNDVMKLYALFEITNLNVSEKSVIKSKIQDSGIDIAKICNELERLQTIDTRHFCVNPKSIKEFKSMCE